MNYWACQEDCPISFYNDVFISHCWNISSSGSATTQHDWHLGNASAWHLSHIVENSTEVTLCWKHFALAWQVSSSRIDEIEARELVLCCNFLSPEMFADSNGVVRSSFNCRIVCNNHAKTSFNDSDSSYYSSRVYLFFAIKLVSSQRRKFKEWWSWIK